MKESQLGKDKERREKVSVLDDKIYLKDLFNDKIYLLLLRKICMLFSFTCGSRRKATHCSSCDNR